MEKKYKKYILELGCGIPGRRLPLPPYDGYTMLEESNYELAVGVRKGIYSYIGMDWDKRLIKASQELPEIYQKDNIMLVIANLSETIPLKDQSMDVVYWKWAETSTPDEEIHRILKPGGEVRAIIIKPRLKESLFDIVLEKPFGFDLWHYRKRD